MDLAELIILQSHGYRCHYRMPHRGFCYERAGHTIEDPPGTLTPRCLEHLPNQVTADKAA